MRRLQIRQFYGQTNDTICFDDITLAGTEYTHDKVDWHYHENAYFTFILEGNIIEGNKKEIYPCSAGSLLFHHWHCKGLTESETTLVDPEGLEPFQVTSCLSDEYTCKKGKGDTRVNYPRFVSVCFVFKNCFKDKRLLSIKTLVGLNLAAF